MDLSARRVGYPPSRLARAEASARVPRGPGRLNASAGRPGVVEPALRRPAARRVHPGRRAAGRPGCLPRLPAHPRGRAPRPGRPPRPAMGPHPRARGDPPAHLPRHPQLPAPVPLLHGEALGRGRAGCRPAARPGRPCGSGARRPDAVLRRGPLLRWPLLQTLIRRGRALEGEIARPSIILITNGIRMDREVAAFCRDQDVGCSCPSMGTPPSPTAGACPGPPRRTSPGPTGTPKSATRALSILKAEGARTSSGDPRDVGALRGGLLPCGRAGRRHRICYAMGVRWGRRPPTCAQFDRIRIATATTSSPSG